MSQKSQVQAKQIIVSLCKIFDSFKFSKITPEDFRLAKFNKPEASSNLWRLLFEIISYLNKNDKEEKLVDKEQSFQIFSNERHENIIESIKKSMISLGYASSDFINLEESLNSSRISSREALIAVGWLIHTYQLIDTFIRNANSFADEEYFKSNNLKALGIDHFKKEIENQKLQFESNKNKDLLAQLNYIKWLKGQFNLKLNAFYTCLIEKGRLTSKAHNLTKNFQAEINQHLSCLEIYLLKNPDKIKKYEKILEEKVEVQTDILFWLNNEDTFWKWMESVLDEKELENLRKNENIEFQLLSNVNKEKYDSFCFEIIKENIKNAYSNQVEFNENIGLIKELEMNIRKDCQLNTNDLDTDTLSIANLSQLKAYEAELRLEFEGDVFNIEKFLKTNKSDIKDDLRLNLFEPRLILKSKLNEVNSKVYKKVLEEKDIESEISTLSAELNNLQVKFNENNKKAINTCNLIAAKLKDCYVVYKK